MLLIPIKIALLAGALYLFLQTRNVILSAGLYAVLAFLLSLILQETFSA